MKLNSFDWTKPFAKAIAKAICLCWMREASSVSQRSSKTNNYSHRHAHLSQLHVNIWPGVFSQVANTSAVKLSINTKRTFASVKQNLGTHRDCG